MSTLVTTPRRTWTTDFPGERPTLREARLLDEQDAHEGPATDADVARYADFFVRVLGSVYKNTRFAQTIRCRGKVCAVFCFGEAPDVSEAKIRARWGRRPPPNGGFYEGNTLAITAPDNARQWTREIGVLDADVIFSDLVRQGF